MSKAPIDVNGRFMTRRPTGIDRFAGELLQAWLETYGVTRDVRILLPPVKEGSVVPAASHRAVTVGSRSGHLWEQIELPQHTHEHFLLNFCNSAPVFKRKQLAVLHDASVMANPSMFGFLYRSWHRRLSAQLMRRAAVLATVSKFSADELGRYFGTRTRGIEIIYESGEHILRTAADRGVLGRLDLVGRRYVLAVGSRTLNKNFGAVVHAAGQLSDLGVKVVAAGGSNSRVFAGAPLASDNLVLAGYVSDGELRALYENAECFVFPSFYEGFGLPPLEAMHCGCPTLVSDRSSIPEVCGSAALYCNPDDPADIARQLQRILTSPALRLDIRDAGYERVKQFTWRRAADTLDALLPC